MEYVHMKKALLAMSSIVSFSLNAIIETIDFSSNNKKQIILLHDRHDDPRGRTEANTNTLIKRHADEMEKLLGFLSLGENLITYHVELSNFSKEVLKEKSNYERLPRSATLIDMFDAVQTNMHHNVITYESFDVRVKDDDIIPQLFCITPEQQIGADQLQKDFLPITIESVLDRIETRTQSTNKIYTKLSLPSSYATASTKLGLQAKQTLISLSEKYQIRTLKDSILFLVLKCAQEDKVMLQKLLSSESCRESDALLVQRILEADSEKEPIHIVHGGFTHTAFVRKALQDKGFVFTQESDMEKYYTLTQKPKKFAKIIRRFIAAHNNLQ